MKRKGGARYCQKCNRHKPPRTHHCRVCQRCVLRMDHHCPWTNNCIGHANYRVFLLFLICECVQLVVSDDGDITVILGMTPCCSRYDITPHPCNR